MSSVSISGSASIDIAENEYGEIYTNIYLPTFTPYPVTISLAGVTGDGAGNFCALAGQPISASIHCGVGTFTSWQWLIQGANFPFAGWDPSTSVLSYLPSQPIGSQTVTFYDLPSGAGGSDSVTVKCTAQLDLPDGTSVTVTAVSQSVSILKPFTDSEAFTTANPNPDAPGGSYGAYILWSPVEIDVPSPFSGGTGAFAQVVDSLSASVTRNPASESAASTYNLEIQDGSGNWNPISISGLDAGWLDSGFGQSGFYPPDTGSWSDSPSFSETAGDVDGGGADWISAEGGATFSNYLMYVAPSPSNAMWIPLEVAYWGFSDSAALSSDGETWTVSGSSPSLECQTTNMWPIWSYVLDWGQLGYRP